MTSRKSLSSFCKPSYNTMAKSAVLRNPSSSFRSALSYRRAPQDGKRYLSRTRAHHVVLRHQFRDSDLRHGGLSKHEGSCRCRVSFSSAVCPLYHHSRLFQNHFAFSPNPWFIAAFFSGQVVLQLTWIRQLFRVPPVEDYDPIPNTALLGKSIEEQNDIDERRAWKAAVGYAPVYALGNLCIGA